MSFLNEQGLERLWQHITARLGSKVGKVDGKGLSTNDYTDEDKNKLTDAIDGVSNLNILVGDIPVSEQITSAIEEFEDATIAYVDEKFAEIPEFDPKELQDAIALNTTNIVSNSDAIEEIKGTLDEKADADHAHNDLQEQLDTKSQVQIIKWEEND
jgi:hypothetical protein